MISRLRHFLVRMRGERPVRIRGTVTVFGTDVKTGALLYKSVQRNLVMQGSLTGLDLVIQWIIGQMATGQGAAAFINGVNYGEIGTGNTAVAITDTGNTTPSARVIPSLQNDIAQAQAVLQFYFPDASLTNQTYYEFATFINGTGTLGSGNIFNHALFGTPYAKTSGMDTTVQVTFTLSQ
jgi:hypothetical protein